MNTEAAEPLYDEIAAQYVLGTLSADARARFEARMLMDEELQKSVAQWEQRLLPMLAVLPPEPPSAQVWQGIERRLFADRAQVREQAATPWWRRLGWTTALAGVLLAAGASALLTMNLMRSREAAAPAPVQVAALNDAAGATALLLRMQSAPDGRLAVVAVSTLRAPNVTGTQALELWTIAPGAAPRSLGLLPAAGSAPFIARGTIGAADTLAVSVEPAGGSTTGAPTGPVILQGKVLGL